MKPKIAVWACAVLALAACGGSDDSGSPPATKVHTAAEGRFSVAVPVDWKGVKPARTTASSYPRARHFVSRTRRSSASEGRSEPSRRSKYGLVESGRAYVLTFTTLPEQEASYDATFEAAAKSFKITE